MKLDLPDDSSGALSRLHSRHSARRRPLPGGCQLVQAEALSGVGRAATRGQAEAGLKLHSPRSRLWSAHTAGATVFLPAQISLIDAMMNQAKTIASTTR